jgi:uncharacterized protein (DUF2235 family)
MFTIPKNIAVLTLLCFCIALSGCQYTLEAFPRKFDGNKTQGSDKKSIFVFYDGTNNRKASSTNVYKLHSIVKQDRNPSTHVIWIEGVGASSRYITGNVFGGGIESRLNAGYRFISERYSPGDDIYIFGFSRGAHQARALAGLISYAGLIEEKITDKNEFNSMAHTIIEITKKTQTLTTRIIGSHGLPGKSHLLVIKFASARYPPKLSS